MNRLASKLLFILSILFLFSCSLSEPVEFYSPDAGFLQVFIKSDDLDTDINIFGVDYNISNQDSMDLLVYQGKAYDLDSNYAILYKNIKSWRQEEFVYNILDWSNNEGYRSFKIYESHVPPGNYNLITVGLIASVINVGPYRIPISLPQDVDGVRPIPVNFSISERGVSRINLSIKPFVSMSRYQDTYVFDRMIEVESVEYFGQDMYDQIIMESDSLAL